MRLFKQNILSYFKSKRLNVFLLFIVLAFLFSVLSKLSQRYTHSFVFKINAINVPEDHVVLSDSTNVMTIALTTYGFRHIKYYLRNPEIDVDFSNLDKTKTHYKWIESNEISKIINQFATNITVENITPDTIAFRYDVNSVKMVPVKLVSNIKFSAGYDVINAYQLEPDSIKIIGPKLITDSISEIKTKSLNLENINADINHIIELNLPKNSKEIKVSKSTVEVKGKVEKFTEGTIEVPVNVINVPENIKINFYPKTVPVIFYTSLSNFKSISSSSFLVQCDFNTIKENNTHLVPSIVNQPNKIKSAKLNVKQIEFIIVN
ncbi:YbbR-like domain-containing protein [Pontimicrobium sp. SW4]|uniref:YbbR-like domain-containing protein n=1 Tax=Pontimicrobium sp. SW4 TaxID=3153519 RepID=A0AAU7BPK1_9FLAO